MSSRWLKERDAETLQEYLVEATTDLQGAYLKLEQRKLQTRLAEHRVKEAQNEIESERRYRDEIVEEINRRAGLDADAPSRGNVLRGDSKGTYTLNARITGAETEQPDAEARDEREERNETEIGDNTNA